MLDITRLISRAGRVLTGVDRVELAYLRALIADDVPLYAIARTTLGYVLLDQNGAAEIEGRVSGRTEWGPRDIYTAFAAGRPEPVKHAESDLRRFALSRCPSGLLSTMLARHVPRSITYLNTGHSNITDRMLRAVRETLHGRIAIVLHDTIPLDFPEYQRDGIPGRFEAMLLRIQNHADLIICNSKATEDSFHRHSVDLKARPDTVVAHLGVDIDLDEPPDTLELMVPEPPYFIAVGTIEPRKRYDLLLDVWDELVDHGPPRLYVCGPRGWKNEHVFQRLDEHSDGSAIYELNELGDRELSALMQNAVALLFPSDAEGFGLPPVEAAAMGVPVICQDLPVFREILGDIPVYVKGSDRYLWKNIIERLIHDQTLGAKTVTEQKFVPPTWEAHFNIVLKLC